MDTRTAEAPFSKNDDTQSNPPGSKHVEATSNTTSLEKNGVPLSISNPKLLRGKDIIPPSSTDFNPSKIRSKPPETSSITSGENYSKNLKSLARGLKMSKGTDAKSFLQSAEFVPHWNMLCDKSLKLEREKSAAKKQSYRGPEFKTVHARLLQGEHGGRAKYSDRYRDESKFDSVDFLACFLCDVVEANKRRGQGIFHDKDEFKSDQERYWIMWQAYLYQNTKLPASKQKATEQRKTDKADKILEPPATPITASKQRATKKRKTDKVDKVLEPPATPVTRDKQQSNASRSSLNQPDLSTAPKTTSSKTAGKIASLKSSPPQPAPSIVSKKVAKEAVKQATEHIVPPESSPTQQHPSVGSQAVVKRVDSQKRSLTQKAPSVALHSGVKQVDSQTRSPTQEAPSAPTQAAVKQVDSQTRSLTQEAPSASAQTAVKQEDEQSRKRVSKSPAIDSRPFQKPRFGGVQASSSPDIDIPYFDAETRSKLPPTVEEEERALHPPKQRTIPSGVLISQLNSQSTTECQSDLISKEVGARSSDKPPLHEFVSSSFHDIANASDWSTSDITDDDDDDDMLVAYSDADDSSDGSDDDANDLNTVYSDPEFGGGQIPEFDVEIQNENKSTTRDLSYRYWQIEVIRSLLHAHTDDVVWKADETYAHDENLSRSAESELWRRELEAVLGQPFHGTKAVTQEDIQAFKESEQHLRSIDLERLSSREARRALGISRGGRLYGLNAGISLQSWQIPAVHAMIQFSQKFSGALLADVMGLGKTIEITGHILAQLRQRNLDAQNGLQLNHPRPTLLLVPPTALRQTVRKIQEYSSLLDVLIYHGDSRIADPGVITGLLTKEHEIFTDNEDNARLVVVSTHATWASRHGPSKVKEWLLEEGEAARTADRMSRYFQQDCPYLIPYLFGTVWVDEAHEIKRETSSQSLSVQWLRANFTGLATATPGINNIRDFRGYLRFIQPRVDNMIDLKSRWTEHDPAFNPYELDQDHRAVNLRLDAELADKFIFDNEDKNQAGLYLSKLLAMCTIRRTYASRVDDIAIGDNIPPILRHMFRLQYSEADQATYDRFAVYHNRKLIQKLPDGRLVWNQKHFRALILLSFWPGFHYILDKVYAPDLEKWQQADNLLYDWLMEVHDSEPLNSKTFNMPDYDEHIDQIRIICRHSPKMRAILALAADCVRFKKKQIVWVLFPAEQLLVWDILNKLNIDARMFSSNLGPTERQDLIDTFTGDPEQCMILINSYAMNSCGLDLQALCCSTISCDIPMSRAVKDQADHRVRRFGQTNIVHSWSLEMVHTFNDRQRANNLEKAFAGVMSEINTQIFDVTQDDYDKIVSLGDWVLCQSKLFQANDPRVTEARLRGDDVSDTLSPEEVINCLLWQELGDIITIEVPQPVLPPITID